MTRPQRPIVRYFGGKWMLADWIISHFPNHRIYIEPFGGGGSVLLKKKRSYAEIYNDIDGEIVNVFLAARDHGAKLKEKLLLTPFARDEFFLSYQKSADPVEQARRTIMRSFMGFGSDAHAKVSGFRANSNRSGTTPAHDWKNYAECFDGLIDRLRGVVIENRDAMRVMAAHDAPDALHYVDPPYMSSTRGKGGIYRHEVGDDFHVTLAEFLKTLKGGVIVSGYDSQEYSEIFAGWTKVEKATHADGARKRVECLWISPKTEKLSKTLFNYWE